MIRSIETIRGAWRLNGILERFARLSVAWGTLVRVEDGLDYVGCAF